MVKANAGMVVGLILAVILLVILFKVGAALYPTVQTSTQDINTSGMPLGSLAPTIIPLLFGAVIVIAGVVYMIKHLKG